MARASLHYRLQHTTVFILHNRQNDVLQTPGTYNGVLLLMGRQDELSEGCGRGLSRGLKMREEGPGLRVGQWDHRKNTKGFLKFLVRIIRIYTLDIEDKKKEVSESDADSSGQDGGAGRYSSPLRTIERRKQPI